MGGFIASRMRAYVERGALARVCDRRLAEIRKRKQPKASELAITAARAFVEAHKEGSLTEYLLTSPTGMNLDTATPAQRAACRILDGVPLGDLETHPDVLELVGSATAVSQLPSERGHKPLEVVFLAGIRSAKTRIACCAAMRMALTVDISGLKVGEYARVSLLSLKLRLAGVSLRMMLDTINQSDELRPLLIGEPTAESFWLANPMGQPVEITVAAGAAAGGSLVSVWSAGVLFDEAPRMDGANEAVVNLDHARTAVLGRLLPGAQALYVGSPWAPFGPVYDKYEKYWQRPEEDQVVIHGTGPMLNPTWWTPERCEKLQEKDEDAYQTDCLAEFGGVGGGIIGKADYKRNERPSRHDGKKDWLPFDHRKRYYAGMDPSDGKAHGNPWTLTIVEVDQIVVERRDQDDEIVLDEQGQPVTRLVNKYRVAAYQEWIGVRPKEAIKGAAKLCRAYGLRTTRTDQYSGEALADIAIDQSFILDVVPWTAPRKLRVYTNLTTLVESDLIEFPADAQFRRDILSVRKRKTQSSTLIIFPLMGGGRHCDYAPSLASAIEQAPEPQQPPPEVSTAHDGSRWSNYGGRGFG